jgi:ribonuclease G
MSKEMIVSVNGREKKIAILENGKVTEFYIERGEENSGVVGNVYKGRVMRVLPGMQSAFVDIGLERDAFLYVSDFFDEEEEIERIVMEKGKKGSPEDAKREANEHIDRQRIEREKQMESVQELAEPIAGSGIAEIKAESAGESNGFDKDNERPARGRGRRDKRKREDFDVKPEAAAEESEPSISVDFGNSDFERVSDDEETGELFKDAYLQEAIVDKVRSIEFEMDDSAGDAVGSLLGEVSSGAGQFERVADEDDPEPAPSKGRKRSTAAKPDKPAAKTKAPKETKKKAPSSKKSSAKGKKVKGADVLEDAEASVRTSESNAEMAVRRGGRGRRRGSVKPKGADQTDEAGDEPLDSTEIIATEAEDNVIPADDPPANTETVVEESRESAPETNDQPQTEALDRPRGTRGRNNRGGRNDRTDWPNADRQNGDRERGGKRFDRRDRPPQAAISDLLREGQEILVQIAKEPIAKKGARITSHIALPGRFLVYMPTIEHLGVSRKIESSSERGRLRSLIQRIRQEPEIPSGGFIVRTAGIGISEEDLSNDAKYLVRMWVDAKKQSEKRRSPAIVHQDLDLVQRILRDQLSDDFTAIRVDSEEEYLRTVEFINLIQPRSVNRIKLYTRDEPILDYYGVQEEIDKALKPRVWLKSGGYLVINQTEALVAIDVNTGKFVGKGNARLEDTITRTNMEAVEEIARQIRLRDLGGIIVLDLIDMEDRRNRHKVSQALQEALAHDRSPTKVLSFNDFGLIIMTRKRVKQSLERTMCAPCDNCEGSGWVKSPITVCYEILAEARRLSKSVEDIRHTTLRVHPDVARTLRESEREVLYEIETYLGNVDIASDRSAHQGQFDFAFV